MALLERLNSLLTELDNVTAELRPGVDYDFGARQSAMAFRAP